MIAPLALSLASAVWMVHRIHGHAADRGTDSLPAGPAGLAHGDVFVLGVAHFADGGLALQEDLSDLSRRELHLGVFPFLSHQLDIDSSAAGDLASLADFELHI